MIARMHLSPRRRPIVLASLLLLSVPGCHGLSKKHEANRVPQFGTVDANQPGSSNYLAATQVTQSVNVAKAPTRLVATPVSFPSSSQKSSVTFTATLTTVATGLPIAGQLVTFADGSLTLCSGTTNTKGIASCTGSNVALFTLLLSPNITATYAGDADYVGSSGTARLTPAQ